MTEDEAAKIGAIVARADGGCQHCVADLAERLHAEFPQFDWKRLAEPEGSWVLTGFGLRTDLTPDI